MEKLEKRGDMRESNVRSHVEALGGMLEITAHFADTTVAFSNMREAS
jgi:hypothetical protein